MICKKKNNIFDETIKRNKPSPIYPFLGVYTKVCFAYKIVMGKFTEDTPQQTTADKRTNNILTCIKI